VTARSRAAFFAAAACSLAGAAAPSDTPQTLRPSDLVETPAQFVNHTVEVEIVERLNGVGGDAHAQACVALPESAPCVLSLVPPTFAADAPDRYARKFDTPLRPPVRVRGELLRDDGLTKVWPGYVIRVISAEPLPVEAPTRIASVAELLAHGERWNRHRIEVEGTWLHGFEVSTLDSPLLWLSVPRDAEVLNTPKKLSARGNRVRVTGLVFARPGRGYGHMGAATALLVASKLEYLGKGR
jgi:hypothetical protein